MSYTIYVVLFGWIAVTLGLFSLFTTARAIIACYVGGMLFLPRVAIPLADGLPPWTADASLAWFTCFCAIVFSPQRLGSYRFHWIDGIVVIGTLSWGISPLVNGLGLQQALLDWWWYVNWACIPYFLGRIFLTQATSLLDITLGIVIGALIYAPFVLIEARLSPQLNNWVYGFNPASVANAHRWGGFRPSVFMPTGLALALWMSLGAMLAWGAWMSGTPRRVLGLPTGLAAAALSVVAVISKGAGALILFFIGSLTLAATRYCRITWPFHAIVLAIILYIVSGVSGSLISIRPIFLDLVASLPHVLGSDERIGSLEFRFRHEAVLSMRAREKILLGWGGWGQNRIDAETALELLGRNQVVTDGFWIIVFGQRGLIGLVATYAWMLVPGLLAVRMMSGGSSNRRFAIIVAGLYAWTALFAADLLLNGFVSPVQGLVAGALVAFTRVASSVRSRSSGVSRHLSASAASEHLTSTPKMGDSNQSRSKPSAIQTLDRATIGDRSSGPHW